MAKSMLPKQAASKAPATPKMAASKPKAKRNRDRETAKAIGRRFGDK